MTDLSRLKIFATHPHDCSYLEGEEATTIFVDPNFPIDVDVYSKLSALGFRRSGCHLYRPHCTNCSACIPARIQVNHFKPSKQQRRTWRKNQDLTIKAVDRINETEHYQLYQAYISDKHADGDMYPPTEEQYHSFLTSEWGTTTYYEFRLSGRLVVVAVTDKMLNGLSSVYTFYDPGFNQRSLGVYAVLKQIEIAQRLSLPYVYLGYWIKNCPKMSYKTQYRPIELFMHNRWTWYQPDSV